MEEFNSTVSNVKMFEFPNLHLEITAYCCANCVFCGYRYIKRKKGIMSRELISKILDEAAGWEKPMKEIVPVHYGEFFLRKDWFEILKEIEEKLPNTSIAIPTTGYPLGIGDAAKLAQISTLKYLSFSVYAFFDETYERLIGLPAENIEKISRFIHVLKPLRNDLSIAVGTTNTPPFMTDFEHGLFKKRWGDLAETHSIIANKQINPELQKSFPYPISCFTIFGSMAILWDGKAVACCFDPNGQLEVGDACKDKVLDIWNGERMKELQRKHVEGLRDEIELCRSCTFGGAFVGEVKWGIGMTLLELFKSHYDPKNYNHIGDADVFVFAQEFNEPKPSMVLEIGANDEPVSNILSLAGYTMFGVDLKPYMYRVNLTLNFTFIQGDFNRLDFGSPFDAIVSLSTIEHVGLGPYGETPYADGDILTMENIYKALRNGGKVYLTVPVGIHQVTLDWRVYDKNDLKHRIIGRFNVLKTRIFASGKVGAYNIGDDVPEEVAFKQTGPNVSVLLVLQKNVDQEIKQ